MNVLQFHADDVIGKDLNGKAITVADFTEHTKQAILNKLHHEITDILTRPFQNGNVTAFTGFAAVQCFLVLFMESMAGAGFERRFMAAMLMDTLVEWNQGKELQEMAVEGTA